MTGCDASFIKRLQMMSNISLHKLASPATFMRMTNIMQWPCALLAALLMGYGVYLGLVDSPADYQQGETVRIMYIHVPSAWLSMFLYASMALASAGYIVWRHPLADLWARNAAPVGAAFTLITLITGSLWGKPMWGAWWVWDARLTSVLVLFFLYVGYMAITNVDMIDERNRMVAAILSLFGAINLPIIKFSVDWWNTLHQPASIMRAGGSSIDPSMMQPLFVMFGGLFFFAFYCILLRMKASLIRQKRQRIQLQSMSASVK